MPRSNRPTNNNNNQQLGPHSHSPPLPLDELLLLMNQRRQWLTSLHGQPPPRDDTRITEACLIFDDIDTNGDGVINRAEWRAAMRRFNYD